MGGKVWMPVVNGPLASWAVGYAKWLAAGGYAPATVSQKLGQLRRLSVWLDAEGFGAGELTGERVAEFARVQRKAGRSSQAWGGLKVPLAYLRSVGVAPVVPPQPRGPVGDLLDGYRRYLLCERGLAEKTLDRYEPDVELFLSRLARRPQGLDLERLQAADVSAFLAGECRARSVEGARHLAGALRSVLGYLHVAGMTPMPLRWAVPAVAELKDRSLPRDLEACDLEKLLAGCDRGRLVGQRDYAIILLLSRLGLRADEVAGMRLEDLDWSAGEIMIAGKGARHDRLPLPVDVGRALVEYLRRRGGCGSRALFLRVRAPIGSLSRAAISAIVHAACVRGGVTPVYAHRLRHTAATGMLRAGASLSEVAEVLRHEQLQTTAIYAKVDRRALRGLARPWPGVLA
jgi:integrase/recombinase XerD